MTKQNVPLPTLFEKSLHENMYQFKEFLNM